jgi:hypothetical protein
MTVYSNRNQQLESIAKLLLDRPAGPSKICYFGNTHAFIIRLFYSCLNQKCSPFFSISRITPPPTALPAMPTSRPPTSSSSLLARTRLPVMPTSRPPPPTPSLSTSNRAVRFWSAIQDESCGLHREYLNACLVDRLRIIILINYSSELISERDQ